MFGKKNISEKPIFFRAKNATVSTLRSGTDYCWLYCDRNLRVVVFKRTNLRQKSDMNMFAENAYGGCLQLKHQICKTLDIYG